MPFDLETKNPLNAEGNVERYSHLKEELIVADIKAALK